MKTLIILSVLFIATSAHAAMYSVTVKRVSQDLYMFGGGVIQTRYCYEYTYGDEAILKYDRYAYDNKLIFSTGTVCDVVTVVGR